MKNKIEFKKAIISSFIVIIIFNIIFLGLNFYQYKTYKINFNEKINMIFTKVNESYPNIEKNELIEILNNEKGDSEDLLKEYGINLNKDSLILENDKYFSKFLVLNISVVLILSLILIFIFIKYNNSKDKKLSEITKYIEEINNGNYKLDIEDNTEDELSILKNEIYKVTVMLKEIAENSLKDKINLKDSLSDISHQLKTPLTSIIIMIDEILENEDMDIATRNDFFKDIKREITNINFLVASLLKLSKFNANTIKFFNKEEHIDKILQEAVKNVSLLCDLKNIKINLNGNKESKVKCDFKWQVEAITNILKNCIEHSNTNSKISINYKENKIYSKIEIKDEGVGIDKEDLPHIFERFYKGKNSSNDSIGIGLALAKSIIEKNNGYISVNSKLNEGSIFTIKYFKN
ncbi:MAG: sensor histidine kinase [Clostridium sp.]